MRLIAADTLQLTYKRHARPDITYRGQVTDGGKTMTFTPRDMRE